MQLHFPAKSWMRRHSDTTLMYAQEIIVTCIKSLIIHGSPDLWLTNSFLNQSYL